jgi:hypothetical protein
MGRLVLDTGGLVEFEFLFGDLRAANGSITVSRGDRPIISGFTYDKFVDCIKEIGGAIQRGRRETSILLQGDLF